MEGSDTELFDIIYKSAVLILVIILGYAVKYIGVFSKEKDFATLSNLILYITLPAAILTNLNGLRFPVSLLLLSVFGFLCNWMYIFISKKFGQNKDEQGFMMLNINGYNIGNFSMPFIAFFLEGIPILAISLFDAGSSVMVLGGNYAMAENTKEGNVKFDFKGLLRKIIQSPPITVYVVMVILSLASLDLPSFVIDFAAILGSANTFLAMFMIGIALELNFNRENMQKILKYTSLRYIPAIVLAMLISYVPFIPVEIKLALSLLLVAPVSGSAPIFTEKIGSDVKLSAQVNSLSIILSILIMSSYLVYLGV